VSAALARRDGLAQIAVVLAAVGGYELARLLMVPNWDVALDNAQSVVSVERVTGLAWEGSLQRVFLEVPDVVQAMNVFYFVGHFVLTGVFFLWLYHRSRDAFRLYRNGYLVATALAVVVHWRFPTAPPRLAGIGLEDTLLTLSGIDIGSPTSSALSNPVAAVPSLHAAYALGVGVGLALYGRRLLTRVVGIVYPPAVVLTIVVTGNHFFLDAIAGVAVLGTGFLVAWRVPAGRRSRDDTGRACLT
jgi:membrane-associated phospholipid phosphatase